MTQPLVPPLQLPPAYPAAGEVLDGKYQIERLLGEGGMGAVAKAQHLLRRAPVALKFMSPAILSMSGAVERFVNEGVAASQIDSDHVVRIFDVGTLPTGAPYLVMEYLEGRDLSDILANEGNPWLSIPRAIHFILQSLVGLRVAHAAGIVHRDMKPSNVFVITKDGEADFVKLVDFGISKVKQQGVANITRTNSALGTPLYMSPEQARSPRDVDHRSDLYSVGVILYELLTGRTPFFSETGEFTELLFKIFTQDPPPIQTYRPDLPPALCDAVHRALTRDPKDRYSTTVEMSEALAPWADERSHVIVNRMRARGSRVQSSSPPEAKKIISKPPGQSVIPPPQTHGAAPSDVFAQTQAGDLDLSLGPAARANRAPAPSAVSPAPSLTAPLAPPPPMVASPRTDVGVTRDATPIIEPPAKRRSPLAIAIPVVAVVVLAGAAWIGRGAFAKHSDTLAQDPPVVAPTPSVAAPPSATLTLPASADVAPSAIASALPPTPSVVVPPHKGAPTARPSTIGVTPPPQHPPPPKDLNDLTGKQ
jgi:eukaryotic-like serine/threonine-protein kinase